MNQDRRSFLYFLTAFAGVGTFAAGGIGLIRATGPTADVVAANKPFQIPLAAIPEGETRTFKITGQPLLIWHRNAAQVEQALAQDVYATWLDKKPQRGRSGQPVLPYDQNLTIDHKWLAIWQICPRRRCIPLAQAGDFGGFFCPCDSSHFDMAGRIRKGPVRDNMQTLPATITEDEQYLALHQSLE